MTKQVALGSKCIKCKILFDSGRRSFIGDLCDSCLCKYVHPEMSHKVWQRLK